MSKIARFVGNLVAFASGAEGSERTVFGDVSQSDVLTDNVNADFIRGWALGVDINGFPPEQFFNAIGFTSTQLAAYLHQMGVAEWDSLQEYHTGSIVNIAGILYSSLTDTNIGNDPTSDIVNWSGAVKLAVNAAGTAPIYALRAWVSFDGTSAGAIDASGNVSSVTENATGDFTINFTTSMPDTSYVIGGSVGGTSATGRTIFVQLSGGNPVLKTTSAVKIFTGDNSGISGSKESHALITG